VNDEYVLGFAGHMGSGKSKLSKATASRLGCPISSFGDVVRDEAKSRGVPLTRHNLQTIGQQLIETRLQEFCDAVISRIGDWHRSGRLVIDGFRHLEALVATRGLVQPVPLSLIFVDTPDELRTARLKAREPEVSLHPEYESHPTERSVDQLRKVADLVLKGEDLEQQGVQLILDWLAQRR
jgi:dephospho-CoA kinase